ncbi:zinc finger protein 117-like isoform X2 [Mastacembelus armatus]|uniref:zinc finger protein 117-like isoform X2 n=1 Tax=Mastacembelus armatus TaxID=205130 RepID=UPI000E4656E9|nr:zinc finger protein 117-like isoform X2 [Mastacembelus armatus]
MGTLQHLNAFISERLTTAAVEIFGAVEKTLTGYQIEISRSKQEIDQLRSLLLCPEGRLQRPVQLVSPHCCQKEASTEEDRAPDVTHLHVKEENDQRTDQRGLSCRHQCDTTESPGFVKREGHKEPPSHLYRILTVDQTTNYVKTEPDGDEFIACQSTREAETHCRINAETPGFHQESLEDQLQISHHEQHWPDEQQYIEQDWSPCQDHKDPVAPPIKVKKFTSSSPQEEIDHEYEFPLQSERSDEPHCSSPSYDQTLSNKTFHTSLEKRRRAERDSCELSRLSKLSQPFCSVNPDCPAFQTEYSETAEGVVNGEPINEHITGRRQKRRNSNLGSAERDSTEVDEDVNDFTRERRHTCPICAKRFKESSHLKDHVRIHTGEKPYQCKECGMNFRQRGALTLHMRIHTGERPYQCTECGRRFNRKGDMENHRVTHTGERPHLCMVCGKSFKRKSNLNTHVKIHTEDEVDYMQPL